MTAHETSAENRPFIPEISRTRQRSAVKFTYADLDEAVRIANPIYDRLGRAGRADLGQVAECTGGLRVDSGAFRSLLANARAYGLIETQRERVTLTDLGARVFDTNQARLARANAFLHVELFRRIYERYKDGSLPVDAALHREIEELGVTPKQVERARRMFQKSALQSGFSEHGRDCLIAPVADVATGRGSTELEDTLRRDEQRGQSEVWSETVVRGISGGDEQPVKLHLAVEGLLTALPPAGAVWPQQKRENWLAAVNEVFSLIYTDAEQ